MPGRRLVVLCDGTFNDPSDGTNVFKVERALARTDEQLAFYDAGVGIPEMDTGGGPIGRFFERWAGGAFGYGISKNVMQAYRWVCENYQPGDHLYFLGFSRGAFTARSVVGMIRKLGLLPTPLDWPTLEEAFNRYRDEHHPNCPTVSGYRDSNGAIAVDDICLHFLGVWDTVGALGVPVVGLRTLIAARRWAFHDTRLSSHVQVARQALAVDERRASFLPAPWCADTWSPNDVEQRWFAGCHSDIGGRNGWLALEWMRQQLGDYGLSLTPTPNPCPEVVQTRHESLGSFWRFAAGAVDRAVQQVETDGGQSFRNEVIDATAASMNDCLRSEDGCCVEHSMVAPDERWSLQQAGTMRAPRRAAWGFARGYYLGQYDVVCPTGEPDDHCCAEYTAWLASDRSAPVPHQCALLAEQRAAVEAREAAPS